MYDLPTSILIEDKEFKIRNKGDFRVILDCFVALNDIELEEDLRITTSLIIFYEDFNSIEDVVNTDVNTLSQLVQAMYRFFNCNEESVGAVKPYRLVDWENDSQMVIASINAVAHKEIRSEPYVHWWTFMGYYLNIGDGAFANIISIREKIVKQKKLEKYEQEFVNDNPQYFKWEWRTDEQLQEDKLVQEIWGE